jgi:hypothetical protein
MKVYTAEYRSERQSDNEFKFAGIVYSSFAGIQERIQREAENTLVWTKPIYGIIAGEVWVSTETLLGFDGEYKRIWRIIEVDLNEGK